jgi:hypothetical protein
MMAAVATATLATGASAAPVIAKFALTTPVPIDIRSVSAKADLAAKYTIRDFGAPPTGTYSSSSIVAFNDSDQIVGTGKHGSVTDCVLYTGSAFISLSPSPSVTSCTPLAMNDANTSTKSTSIVGYINYAFAEGSVAFEAAASTTKLLNMLIFSGNVPSQLTAVNNAGQAIGTEYYEPPGGFTGPPVVYTNGGSNLTIAQPSCTKRQKICTANLAFTSCPVAGCDFDDKGDVESVPIFSGSEETEMFNITTGNCCTTNDEVDSTSSRFISDYGNAVGAQTDIGYFDVLVNGEDLGQPNQSEELGDCLNNPVSFSNKGNMLVVSQCYPGHENWTWDPTHGFFDVAAALPANSYSKIVPLAVNDSGHVLVELYPHSGPLHWGVLVPPASSNSAVAKRFLRARNRLRLR